MHTDLGDTHLAQRDSHRQQSLQHDQLPRRLWLLREVLSESLHRSFQPRAARCAFDCAQQRVPVVVHEVSQIHFSAHQLRQNRGIGLGLTLDGSVIARFA
jgi:hypothetical protein